MVLSTKLNLFSYYIYLFDWIKHFKEIIFIFLSRDQWVLLVLLDKKGYLDIQDNRYDSKWSLLQERLFPQGYLYLIMLMTFHQGQPGIQGNTGSKGSVGTRGQKVFFFNNLTFYSISQWYSNLYAVPNPCSSPCSFSGSARGTWK